MALQTSGTISLNDIHVEAGGASGTQCSLNDSDIRGLIGKASGAQSSFSEFYGAASAYRYWRWYITGRRGADNAGIQVSEWDWMNGNSPTNVTPTNPSGSNPSGEGPAQAVDNSTNSKWLDFNFGGTVTNVNNGFSILQFDFGSPVQINGYRWWTANDAPNRDPVSWLIQRSSNNISWTTVHTVTNASITTTRQSLVGTFTF